MVQAAGPASAGNLQTPTKRPVPGRAVASRLKLPPLLDSPSSNLPSSSGPSLSSHLPNWAQTPVSANQSCLQVSTPEHCANDFPVTTHPAFTTPPSVPAQLSMSSDCSSPEAGLIPGTVVPAAPDKAAADETAGTATADTPVDTAAADVAAAGMANGSAHPPPKGRIITTPKLPVPNLPGAVAPGAVPRRASSTSQAGGAGAGAGSSSSGQRGKGRRRSTVAGGRRLSSLDGDAEFQGRINGMMDNRRVRDVFMHFDEDQTGTIDRDELGNVMRMLGENPTHGEIETILREVDANNDGVVDFAEFCRALCRQRVEYDLEDRMYEINEAFGVFPVDGDGFISAENFREVMMEMGDRLSEEEFKQMLIEVQADEEGKVNLEVFKSMPFYSQQLVLGEMFEKQQNGSGPSDLERITSPEYFNSPYHTPRTPRGEIPQTALPALSGSYLEFSEEPEEKKTPADRRVVHEETMTRMNSMMMTTKLSSHEYQMYE